MQFRSGELSADIVENSEGTLSGPVLCPHPDTAYEFEEPGRQILLFVQGHYFQGLLRLIPVAVFGLIFTLLALWRKSKHKEPQKEHDGADTVAQPVGNHAWPQEAGPAEVKSALRVNNELTGSVGAVGSQTPSPEIHISEKSY